MKTLVGRLVLGCAFALPAAASADIFRCVSEEGETTYSDAPCPGTAALSSNISDTLDHCTTAECVAQREKARAEARQRLAEERELLSRLTEARLKEEALYTDRLVRMQELRTLDERLALERAQQAGVFYPAYGFGGVGPDFDRDFGNCKPPHCSAPGFKRGFGGRHFGRHKGVRVERPIPLLTNRAQPSAHRRKF